LSTGDFESWIDRLFLKRLRWGRGGGGSSYIGDSGRYVREVSGCGNLSPWWPLSIRGEPGIWVGGRFVYRGRRAVVVGYLSPRDSMKGTFREGSFTGEPER